MNSRVFLIIFTIFSSTSSQSISCDYLINNGLYSCHATIQNPSGLDANVQIDGVHLEGHTDDDIRVVRIVSGSTTVIPSAICQKFQFIEHFRLEAGVGLRNLTEGALRDCAQLREADLWLNMFNVIHPLTFQNNVLVTRVLLSHLQVTTLPESLFATLESTINMEIPNNIILSDMPPNIFEHNSQITSLRLSNCAFNIWRPEWAKNLNQLTLLWLNTNRITTIPRNSVNSNVLREIRISFNQIEEIEFFHFNNLRNLSLLTINGNPVKAIDFNLIDQMTSLSTIMATNLFQIPPCSDAHETNDKWSIKNCKHNLLTTKFNIYDAIKPRNYETFHLAWIQYSICGSADMLDAIFMNARTCVALNAQ